MPKPLNLNLDIEKDSSLPATIFNHYFGKRPETEKEYKNYLAKLEKRGIFLIDIYKKPDKFRDHPEEYHLIIEGIPKLKEEINLLNPEEVIFLPARSMKGYNKGYIEHHYPGAKFCRWKEFRMQLELLNAY